VDYFLRNSAGGLTAQKGEVRGVLDMSGDAADSFVEVEERDLNGEEIRRGIESWRALQAVRAGISGLGFIMAVVGIWGDGVVMKSKRMV